MVQTRRDTVKLLAAGLAGTLVLPRLAQAQKARAMHLVLQGFSLGIHIPQVLAVRDLMQQAGYAEPQLDRIESMQVIAQTIVSNSADAGDSDVASALRAIEAGAPVTLIGLVYNGTSQVLLANTDKIKSFADFKNPENAIAMNSRGDFIYVMLAGALDRNGLDIDDVTVIEMGGSGSRLKALQSGRVAAVPVHFDQADEVLKQGPYKILVEPWKVYDRWLSEAWLVNTSWLAQSDNQKAAVALNKAMVASFRRANKDYAYFAAGYRKYATVSNAATVSDDVLKPIWQKLSTEIHAWPHDGGFKRAYLEELLPVYRKAHLITKAPDMNKVIEPRFLDQALQELG
jgi:NitT/TauT family transport system substrate-binding protein